MKRSGPLTLLLMASTAITLTGCGSEPRTEGQVYRDVESCLADGKFSAADCENGYQEALKQHAGTSPRYDSRALCEQQHGFNCQQTTISSGGSGFWTPFMAGYFVSSLLDGTSSRWDERSRPLYRGSGGYLYTTDGSTVTRDSTGRLSVSERAMKTPPKAARVQTRTTVAARGGFGARSSAGS